jgi:hypothetical protein
MHARIIPVKPAGQSPVDPQSSDIAWPASLIDLMRDALASGQDRWVLTLQIDTQADTPAQPLNPLRAGMTPAQFCKGLNGVNVMQLGHFLKRRRWLYNESASGLRWRVASYARDRYMVEQRSLVAPKDREPFIAHTPVLLPKGARRLYELYRAGKLPMKQGWDNCFTTLDIDSLHGLGGNA